MSILDSANAFFFIVRLDPWLGSPQLTLKTDPSKLFISHFYIYMDELENAKCVSPKLHLRYLDWSIICSWSTNNWIKNIHLCAWRLHLCVNFLAFSLIIHETTNYKTSYITSRRILDRLIWNFHVEDVEWPLTLIFFFSLPLWVFTVKN